MLILGSLGGTPSHATSLPASAALVAVGDSVPSCGKSYIVPVSEDGYLQSDPANGSSYSFPCLFLLLKLSF